MTNSSDLNLSPECPLFFGCVPPFTQGQVLCVKGGTHPFFYHEGTKAQSLTKSLRGSFVSLWLIFSDKRRDASVFYHEDTKSHEVSLWFLCVFVADFFGCVKGGTHPFLPRRHEVSRSLFAVPLCLCVFVALWLIFSDKRRDTSVFLPRRHKVSRSLFVVPLCLCVFVADFFGCVKGGTHPFFQQVLLSRFFYKWS
ncbi:Uncharacterized protein dnm_013260 [Desulfonema magnum]|uniref:Transmembrane protein n=1 Tax=Desulfonema magnum TaxID=45655 RepID=A0A975BH48_9BACT|nr:Uncharacterized protein dnm_013260 [Desulfonema magnum]